MFHQLALSGAFDYLSIKVFPITIDSIFPNLNVVLFVTSCVEPAFEGQKDAAKEYFFFVFGVHLINWSETNSHLHGFVGSKLRPKKVWIPSRELGWGILFCTFSPCL